MSREGIKKRLNSPYTCTEYPADRVWLCEEPWVPIMVLVVNNASREEIKCPWCRDIHYIKVTKKDLKY